MSPEQLLHQQRSVGEQFIDAIDRKFADGKHEPGRQYEEILELRRDDNIHYSWRENLGILLQRPKPGQATMAAEEWRRFGGYRLTVIIKLPGGTDGALFTGDVGKHSQIDYLPVLNTLTGRPSIHERAISHSFFIAGGMLAAPERQIPEIAIHDGNVLGQTALQHLKSEGLTVRQLRDEEAKALLDWLENARPAHPNISRQRAA